MPKFNKDQQAAIDARGCSVLVSAPAGSGKTRILVSRIVDLIVKDHYEITNFLVLTFTEAAGQEMKQRLSDSLHELLPACDEETKIRIGRQIDLLPHAYITNFHGFCSTLLQKYGYLVGVQPGFTINASPRLRQLTVLDRCLNEWLQDPVFCDLFTRYYTNHRVKAFKDEMISFHELSTSYVDFFDFIEQAKENYDFKTLDEWKMLDVLKELLVEECHKSMSVLNELNDYAQVNGIDDFFVGTEKRPSGSDALYDYLEGLIHQIPTFISYDSLVKAVNAKVPTSSRIGWKNLNVDDDVKKTFNNLKKSVTDPFKKVSKELLCDNEENFKALLDITYKDLYTMLGHGGLLENFQKAYHKEKAAYNELDFSDLERYATALLNYDLPIAATLYDSLKEIMIDEYQDTNQIQENLVQKIARYKEPILPIFMVGDMKQSIYRFRQADPQIFKDKYDCFETDLDRDSIERRIDLHFNYRSHKTVLDSINYIFDGIMDEKVGGLAYYTDPSALLNYDFEGRNEKPEEVELAGHETEVLVNISDTDQDLTRAEIEAHMVAQRIIRLIEETDYTYKDIAVLMSTAGEFINYKKIFTRYHIPSSITLADGLMSTMEVMTLTALLKTLTDPYDDISLAATLRSPFLFSHFSENEMIALRTKTDVSLYTNLKESDDEEVQGFLEVLDELSKYAYTHTPYETLKLCLHRSGYTSYLATLPNSEQRVANVDMFTEVLRSNTDYPYLSDLLEAMEAGITVSPGKIADDDANAVTFMTIHKSKGLEFPIVIVANLNHGFNTSDATNRVLLDRYYGLSMKPVVMKPIENYRPLVQYDHSYYSLLGRIIKKASIDEEVRLLYVALTRASKKLVLTGSYPDLKSLTSIARSVLANETDAYHENDHVVFNVSMRNVNNFLDWVMMGVMRHPDVRDALSSIPELSPCIRFHEKRYKGLMNPTTSHAAFKLRITHDPEIIEAIPDYVKRSVGDRYDEVSSYYEYEYTHEDRLRSIAVTTLQRLEDEKHFTYLEGDGSDRNMALSKGTLVHNVLSYLRFDHDDINTLLNTLYDKKMFNEEERQLLIDYLPHLEAYIHSDIYQKISSSKAVYKEKMFRYKEESGRIINGIFDLVFEDEDTIYVLDYKTDKISSANDEKNLIEKHRVQLELYQEVLEKAFKKPSKAYVYYLEIDRCVEIK